MSNAVDFTLGVLKISVMVFFIMLIIVLTIWIIKYVFGKDEYETIELQQIEDFENNLNYVIELAKRDRAIKAQFVDDLQLTYMNLKDKGCSLNVDGVELNIKSLGDK